MLRKILYGSLAGLAGSAAMHAFRLFWELEYCDKDGIFGFDREADVNSARLLYFWISQESLSECHAARVGLALHYAYGAMLGSLYGVTRDRPGRFGKGMASRLGVLLWLCADEIPISLSRISNPFRKSIASHAGALTAPSGVCHDHKGHVPSTRLCK
jgi:hypothetical protein